MTTAPPLPGPPTARHDGGDAPVALFLDTDLGTRLALLVAHDTTIGGLKPRVDAEHAAAFPDLGPVAVKSFEVRRKGELYHLSDSMTVTSAFTKIKGGCFLHVKMTEAAAATRCCQDDGRRSSDGHLGIHVEKRVQKLSAMMSEISCDVLPQMLEGGDAAAAFNDVQAHDALPSSSLLDIEIKKNEAVGLASDSEAECDPVIEKAKSYSSQIKHANQTEGAYISTTSMENVGKPSYQSNITHAMEEVQARKEGILIGDGDCDLGGGVSDNKEVRIQEQMLEEMHAMDNPSQEKEHKKSRTDSFETSAPDPPRITNESDVRDLTKSSRSPPEGGTTSHREPLNTSFRQEVQDTLHEDSTENPSTVVKKKKRKRCGLAPSKASAQEKSEPSAGANELAKSTGDAYKVELNGRDEIAIKSSGLTLSSSGLNDGNQGGKLVQFMSNAQTSTDLISEQGKFDHALKERRNPWNEEEQNEQIKQHDEGSHDAVVAEISNMEKDGEGTDALEKRQTNDNTTRLKKRRKAKKAGSVVLSSLDTTHEKEMHESRENAVRLDTVYTERDIVHDPLTQQSNNVHQGELNIIESPNGDGKKKKRRRRHSESSKGVDPNQDLTKSSEFVTNESLMHFADVAPLDAKQTTPGGIGATVIDHKELGENLSAKNAIDEVLADLRSKDRSSKDLDEDILTGQTHLSSNKNELKLPESTADKVGVSALLPPKYPADAPASSPKLKKSKGGKLEVLSTIIDSSHHSRSVPKEDANGELNESDSLRFSDKASDPKDILNGDFVAQADDKPKATKRQRKKVSLKQVPADNVKTLDEQVSQVDTLDLKGVNATQANDAMVIESASPNAQKVRKKSSNSELQSWDPALEHDSSADLGNLRPEKSLIRPKDSVDAAEHNHDSAVHPASGAINFLDHFISSKMNDPSVSAEHKQDNEDETLREMKNKKKNKRKQGTGSIEPNDVLESLLPTDKTSLTGHLCTSKAVVPFVAAENMNNRDENVKNGKKKRKRKATEMPVAEKENTNSDDEGIVIGTQETLSVIQKGSMGRDNGKDRGSKVTQNDSIVQHKLEDGTLEKKLYQNSVDDQNTLLADKDHVHISKDVRKSTSKLKHHAKSKHDDSIMGRVAPNPKPARNLVKDFSMSPLMSSDSIEGTPQIANRRVAVRKVSSKRYEQASEKSKKEKRKVGAGTIFSDANSEGSDDELDTRNDKAFMEASPDNSAASGDSGISSAAYDESDVPDDDGTVSLSQKSLRDGLHIGSILRGSSSYKKARKKQSELLDDDDTIVPDSQPADGLWD